MKIELIRKETVAVSRWSGGETRAYAIYPRDAVYADRDFDFRISSATIEDVPSQFTNFEGYHRYLAMLDNHVQLTLNGVNQRYEKHQLFAFQSTDLITSYTQGTDFNLMLANHIVDEVVEVTNQSFQTNQPYILLFALGSGAVGVNNQPMTMEPWDCILITNEEQQSVAVTLNQPTIVGYWSISK